MKRREFFSLLAKITIPLVAVVEGFIHLKSLVPKVLYEAPKKFKTHKPGQFPEGVSFLPEHKVFIIRHRNTYKAMSAICTHLGCIVKVVDLPAPKKVKVKGKVIEERWEFHCPCHGSKFYANGYNYAGPAPTPLPHYKVGISPDDGSLLVDKGTVVSDEEYLEVKEA